MDTQTKNTNQSSPLGPGFTGATVPSYATVPNKSISKKILITAGVVAIIVIIGLLVNAVFSYFPAISSRISTALVSVTSSVITAPKLTATVSPLTVTVNQPLTLSWNRNGTKGEGTYSLFYPCADGVRFERTGTQLGNMLSVSEILPCGMNIPLKEANAQDSIQLTAASSDSRIVEVPLLLSYTPTGADTASLTADIFVTIENMSVASIGPAPSIPSTDGTPIAVVPTTPSVPAAPVAPKPTPIKTGLTAGTASTSGYQLPTETTAGTTTQHVYQIVPGTTTISNLPLDLSVKILEVGYINKLTNEFIATSSPKATERIAVRFEVSNIGGKKSPTWHFNAVLPTFPSYTYASESQEALAPGDRIEFTIGFDNIYSVSDKTVVINVDPANSITEPNKVNNIAKVKLDGVIF